jgi:hypothetical protein
MSEMPEGWSPYNRARTKQIREAAPSEAAYQDTMNKFWNAIQNFDPGESDDSELWDVVENFDLGDPDLEWDEDWDEDEDEDEEEF